MGDTQYGTDGPLVRRGKLLSAATGLAAASLALAVLAPVVMSDVDWPTAARDTIAADGYAATGATNLVSAIYLGYRAFDTLGETIVLLVALAGSVALVASTPGRPDLDRDGGPADPRGPGHTDIINVIAGKLAPIVLLFGTYVMLYGHTSPGGGFQGGVVLASGVIFIAIGRRAGGIGRISPSITAFGPRTLSVIEAIAFATVLALSFPGSGAALAGLIEATGASAGVAAKGVAAVGPIIALNIGIGLKVGSGVALLCVMMLGGDQE